MNPIGSCLFLVFLVCIISVSGCSFLGYHHGNVSPNKTLDHSQKKWPNPFHEPMTYKAVIEENEIYQNNRSGLRIRGSMPVKVKNCNIHENGRAGLRIERQAEVLVEDSLVYHNERAGLDARNISKLYCSNLGLFENQGGGIRLRIDKEEGSPKIAIKIVDSDIFLNGQAGLYSAVRPDTHLRMYLSSNKIYENTRAGLRIEGSVQLVALRNEIFSNGTSGIYGENYGVLTPVMDILESRIYFNKKAGILMKGGGTGDLGIINNWIYDNLESGIACLPGNGAYPVPIKIYHNTIVSNGSGDEGAGIRIDSNSTADIANNIITYNLRTGLMVYHCRDFHDNLLFANGQIPEFHENRDDGFLLRRMQYGGCPAPGWGDILADPVFVDSDGYNFSISERSPAAGAAEDLGLQYLKAFDSRNKGALLIPGTGRLLSVK